MTRHSVLHLAASAAWGGAEQMAETLRAECERAGWETRLELPFDHSVRWEAATPRRVSWWRWALKQHGPGEIVHAHLPWPDRVGPALIAARGRPLVVTFQLLPPPDGWPRDRCFHIPSKRMLSLAGSMRDRVRWVALSRADARTLEALLGVRVTIVRNAPPAATKQPDPAPWPEGVLRVLSVGRLDRQKGFDAMLTALAAPEVKRLAWHWNIIGEGPERPTLSAQIRALGLEDRVTLLGARPGIDGFCRAELLLAPSRFEGMPLVPLEAAEASVPVLASTIAPHEELYERVPECLLDRDARAWPAALARWLSDADLRARMRLAQREVLGENPRRAMFSAYESLYRELLG
ncbi:MAG: glycosyltransferase family 4 protein [Polyangiales bacterium]